MRYRTTCEKGHTVEITGRKNCHGIIFGSNADSCSFVEDIDGSTSWSSTRCEASVVKHEYKSANSHVWKERTDDHRPPPLTQGQLNLIATFSDLISHLESAISAVEHNEYATAMGHARQVELGAALLLGRLDAGVV